MQIHPQSDRPTARSVGALFLVSTAAYMLGSQLVDTLLVGPAAGPGLAAHTAQLITGVLLQYVNAAAVVGIGALLFPTLRRHSEAVAIGYVATRLVECVLLLAAGLGTLALLAVPDAPSAAVLLASRTAAYHVAMGALGLGSLPLCLLLFRSRLIPRALALLGLVGYAALLVGSALELYGFDLQLLHNVPGGLFELLLPLWLIAKGFGPTMTILEPATSPRTASI